MIEWGGQLQSIAPFSSRIVTTSGWLYLAHKWYNDKERWEPLHFCQAQCSVSKSIPVVDVPPSLDQNLLFTLSELPQIMCLGWSLEEGCSKPPMTKPHTIWNILSIENINILSDPPGCKEERSAAVSKVKQTWDWETQKASKQNCVEKHWHWHWHLSSCSILAPAFKSAATVPVWLFFTAQSNAVYPHLEDDEIMGTVSCSVSHVLVLDVGTGRNQGKRCVRVTPRGGFLSFVRGECDRWDWGLWVLYCLGSK